ncbi:hydrolase [Brachybacterium halotolerans subsp. kimchii]|uniref:hydrolase n=1 Tax=Brachybacterium halotolerans TaxID=2795215 RepID=UPI001E2D338F|nr:hydrolase [Brachybacterium halotolerans]UEJ81164.1 hydrolase [Brachybacterium halotolerans subsp. kimchii]
MTRNVSTIDHPEMLDAHAATRGLLQCATCGVEYDAKDHPDICQICADERQYLPADGIQHWADPSRYAGPLELVELEQGLFALRGVEGVGIGQEANVLVTEHGNVMVEVPAAITDSAIAAVRDLGPMRAIVPSHPHMFGLQSAWSNALGGVPVWVSRADAAWLGRTPARIHLWEGQEQVVPGVTAAQLGGHFPGSAIVHWTGGDGRGVLLSGDTIAPNPDARTLAFMRSYPNRIPLSGPVALRVAEGAARFDFDRLYGNFAGAVLQDAREAVLASARRHAAWASGEHDELT